MRKFEEYLRIILLEFTHNSQSMYRHLLQRCEWIDDVEIHGKIKNYVANIRNICDIAMSL